jgi:hypothetical protein
VAALRRRPRAATTGHRGDDALLLGLADPDLPHVWRHYFYCRDERGCEAAADEARAAGWSVARADRSTDLPRFVVIAESTTVLTAAAVAEARDWWEKLAERIDGGHYDGWEVVDR